MSVDNLTKEWHETKDMIKAMMAFVGGSLDSWAIMLDENAVMLEENPDMKDKIIEDMKKMAAGLRKYAGVTIIEK